MCLSWLASPSVEIKQSLIHIFSYTHIDNSIVARSGTARTLYSTGGHHTYNQQCAIGVLNPKAELLEQISMLS